MDIQVADYEKLGKFFLGREYDIHTKEMADELVLYDSKDLVTPWGRPGDDGLREDWSLLGFAGGSGHGWDSGHCDRSEG